MAITEAAFDRSYIRLDIHTEPAAGEPVTVRFLDGRDPAGDYAVARGGHGEIHIYMAHWSPGGNMYEDTSECRWISTLGNVTAHELVHVLAPACPHTPYDDGPPTLFGEFGGHAYFGDHVRACIVDAGY